MFKVQSLLGEHSHGAAQTVVECHVLSASIARSIPTYACDGALQAFDLSYILRTISISVRHLGCVRKRRSVRSDRSDRTKTRSVNGRNVGGVWSDQTYSVRKCVGWVGNFDRSPNTDRSILISIDVNKRSKRCHTDLEKGMQQLETPSSLAADVRKCSERSDRSDTTFRTHPYCCLFLYVPLTTLLGLQSKFTTLQSVLV
jgi:hypothetical protein